VELVGTWAFAALVPEQTRAVCVRFPAPSAGFVRLRYRRPDRLSARACAGSVRGSASSCSLAACVDGTHRPHSSYVHGTRTPAAMFPLPCRSRNRVGLRRCSTPRCSCWGYTLQCASAPDGERGAFRAVRFHATARTLRSRPPVMRHSSNASRRNPKSARGFSRCRGSAECREAHRHGFRA